MGKKVFLILWPQLTVYCDSEKYVGGKTATRIALVTAEASTIRDSTKYWQQGTLIAASNSIQIYNAKLASDMSLGRPVLPASLNQELLTSTSCTLPYPQVGKFLPPPWSPYRGAEEVPYEYPISTAPKTLSETQESV